ncbi:MAG: TolC family protein [Planctomycetes bacterium]|nr:TolC family protein [Planctomycetota bacterium]
MPRPLRALAGALFLTAVTLAGCASDRERVAWSEWSELDYRFRPPDEEVAPLTSASTLSDYVAIALRRNPALQAQSQRWRADLERVPQARALPDPELMYGGFVEPVETRVGPQRHRLGVTQKIPWPGKLADRSGMALEASEATRARTEATRLRVIYQVARAYADYYYLARERAVTDDTLTLVRHWESVAQARFRAGAQAAHRDVIKAQVEIGRLEDRLATLTDARRPHVARLRALLDLPAATELPWPSSIPATSLAVSDAEVLTLLEGHSPVLAELDRTIAARERGVDLAWQSYLPDFMLGFEYIEVGPAGRNATGARPSGSGDDAAVVKFGITLPIWFGRYGSAVSEAKARLRAAELDRADAENTLEASVARALFDYRDAERKLRLYGDSLVPKAEQSLQATSVAYEGGAGDFLDVLDAERVLLEFHLARERALADRVRSFAELEMFTGAELAPRTER